MRQLCHGEVIIPPLPTNHANSLRRLENLERKLRKNDLYRAYDAVVQEQKEEGVIEQAPQRSGKPEFYIPHRPVIRENAATTKLRVVYDGSARASPNSPSLNECLNPGPALQNELWGILVRQRVFPVALTGDIRRAFLQIRMYSAENGRSLWTLQFSPFCCCFAISFGSTE